MRFDVAIIGGGAAGLLCAITAGRRRRRTLVIEHNDQVGRKILISGGGRCNFTNTSTTAENFVSKNPHFCRSALARYTPDDIIELVKRHRIEFYEKKLGQLFCRDTSRGFVEMLLTECRNAGVSIKTNCSVEHVEKDKSFRLKTNLGEFECESLVVATGGLSFPKIGATDLGYRIAKQFDLRIEPTRPSLVAMVFDGDKTFSKLAGVTIYAEVCAGGKSFRENILFTHRGLSGPAILQASNYWTQENEVMIDLLTDHSIEAQLKIMRSSKKMLSTFLGSMLPERFVELFALPKLPNKPLNQLSRIDIENIATSMHKWSVRFRETEGWHKAEVTLGGVSTDELSSKTMETTKVPGLYFIGEVIDVTGWLGGYNFQWAWSSGYAAGSSV